MQTIEAYTPSLYLGSGSVAYSWFLTQKNIRSGRHVSSAEIKVFLQNKYLFHCHICDLKCPRNNILKTLSCPGKKKHKTGAFQVCWSAKRINEFMWHYLIATAQKIVRSHRSWLQHQKLWNGNKNFIFVFLLSPIALFYRCCFLAALWKQCRYFACEAQKHHIVFKLQRGHSF